MQPIKDASHLYEVERRAEHAARPGFRITELQISSQQKVPWHYHSNVQDTFYVLEGELRLFLREPKEEVRLGPGETYSVKARRPTWLPTDRTRRPHFWCCKGLANTISCRWCNGPWLIRKGDKWRTSIRESAFPPR